MILTWWFCIVWLSFWHNGPQKKRSCQILDFVFGIFLAAWMNSLLLETTFLYLLSLIFIYAWSLSKRHSQRSLNTCRPNSIKRCSKQVSSMLHYVFVCITLQIKHGNWSFRLFSNCSPMPILFPRSDHHFLFDFIITLEGVTDFHEVMRVHIVIHPHLWEINVNLKQ